MTVTSVFSVSAKPPLLVFSTSQLTSSTPTILRTETAIVHLLDADSLHLAKLCATSGVDRFADEAIFHRLSTGEPLFKDAKVWIRGKIINRFDAGGSTLVVLHTMESSVATNEELPEGSPLVYHNRTWHHIGPHSTFDE